MRIKIDTPLCVDIQNFVVGSLNCQHMCQMSGSVIYIYLFASVARFGIFFHGNEQAIQTTKTIQNHRVFAGKLIGNYI